MKSIINEAINNLENSYSPYSKFQVSAILELKDGNLIRGVNVENASYGGTICAERSAIVSAISQGYNARDFKSFTIVSKNIEPISPCGICRQFFAEFFPKNFNITLASIDGKYINMSVEELLPYGFYPSSLNGGN